MFWIVYVSIATLNTAALTFDAHFATQQAQAPWASPIPLLYIVWAKGSSGMNRQALFSAT